LKDDMDTKWKKHKFQKWEPIIQVLVSIYVLYTRSKYKTILLNYIFRLCQRNRMQNQL
jgi:hypothetical protein